GQETGDPAVAVPEGVDAQEVEDEGGDGDEGRGLTLIDRVTVGETELLDGGGRLGHGDRAEADERRRSLPQLDDLVVDLLPLAGVAAPFLDDPVQSLEKIGGDGKVRGAGMDEVESPAVAADLLFGAVARLGLAEDQGHEAVGSHRDPF